MKKYIFIFCFILFSSISAVTLSMSPPQVDFNGKVGEEICSTVHLEVDSPEIIIGKTLWAQEGFYKRDLLKHNLAAEELKLKVKIEEELQIENTKDLEICVSGKEKGNYHGLLLYKVEGKPIQVGVWLNVSLGGTSTVKITGKAVSEKEGGAGSFFGISLILVIILIGLVIISRRERE